MRRALALCVALVAVIAGVWWALEATDPERADEGTAAAAPDENARAAALAQRMRERIENAGEVDLPAARGPRELRGRVVSAQGPVAGAIVTATVTEKEESLSELPCKCGNTCGQQLLGCMCGEVAGQLVALVGERHGEAQPVARATTDAEGNFVLTGLEDRPHGLWAQAGRKVGLRTGALPGEVAADVRIEEGKFIAGEVKGEDKKAIAGAVVTAINARHSRFFDAISGEDGRFEIGPVPHGAYALVAVHQALLPDNAKVPEYTSEEFALVLERPRLLSGKVLRESVPAGRVTVRLEGEHRDEQVQTAEDGTFVFQRLRAGDYAMTARAGSDSAASAVELKAEDATTTLELRAGARLRGTVRSTTGAAVQGATVGIEVRVGSEWVTVKLTADDQGGWASDVLPVGSARAYSRAEGFISSNYDKFELQPGANPDLALTLAPAAIVSGVVVDPAGNPIAKAALELEGDRDRDDTTTDEAGRFTFKQFGEERGELTATHADWKRTIQEVEAPATQLRIVLHAGAELRGTVLDGENPVGRARIILERVSEGDGEEPGGWSADDGAFVIRGLEPGRYRAFAALEDKEGGRSSTPVTVTVPAPEPVVLRFEDALSISGVVVDVDGKPQPNLKLVVSNPEGKRPDAAEHVYRTAATDEAGAFTVRHLPARSLAIDVSDPERQLVSPQAPVAAGTKDLRLTVKLLPAVTGRAVGDDGRPLTQFMINDDSFSPGDGRFRYKLPRRRAGSGGLRLLFDAGQGWAQTVRTVKMSDRDIALGDVVITRGSTVEGQLVDAVTGAPLPGVLVDAGDEPAKGGRWFLSPGGGTVASDASGRFVLPAVDDRLSMWLYAQSKQHLPLAIPLEVRTGLVLKLDPGAGVSGTVLGLPPGPSKGEVTATAARVGGNGVFRRGEVSADGTFVLGGLPPGKYGVTLDSSGAVPLAYDRQEVTLGEHERAVLEFAPRSGGATVRLTVPPGVIQVGLYPADVAVPTSMDQLHQLPGPLLSGTAAGSVYTFPAVPAGRYVVQLISYRPDGIVVQGTAIDVSGTATLERVIPVDPAARKFAWESQPVAGPSTP